MFWYADKAALRAGRISTTAWDKDNIGYLSFGVNEDTKASGYGSAAFGCLTKATNSYAIAAGFESQANGWGSMAIGDSAVALGNASFSAGHGSRNDSYASLVVGQYNFIHPGADNNDWVAKDIAFVIGNGLSPTARSNAFTVLKNGKTGINVEQPLAMLAFGG
jgi:hypothetical protein